MLDRGATEQQHRKGRKEGLFVGQVIEHRLTGPAGAGSGLITVQLPPDQAALLAGVRTANLYLTLNRPDYEPVPVPFQPIVPGLPGEQGISPYPESSDGNGQ